jgi:hypothetical protein
MDDEEGYSRPNIVARRLRQVVEADVNRAAEDGAARRLAFLDHEVSFEAPAMSFDDAAPFYRTSGELAPSGWPAPHQ